VKVLTVTGDHPDDRYIDTEVTPHDCYDALSIYNLNWFSPKQGIQLEDYILTWEQVDELRKAIDYAETLWRME